MQLIPKYLTGAPENLADFLRCLKGESQNGELVQMIEQEVKKARMHEGWEAEYMTLYLRDQENQEIGIKIGLEQGLEIDIRFRRCVNCEARAYFGIILSWSPW